MILLSFPIVPLYDIPNAKNPNFGNILGNLSSLPRLNGDLPVGSYAVVGFTVSIKPPDDNVVGNRDPTIPSVGYNLHWAMALAK